jgi:outer membrane protein, multidrug efflux system
MPTLARTNQGVVLALLLTLTGCTTPPVSPESSLAIPSAWSVDTPLAPREAGRAIDAWWSDFGSAELNALIESALQTNRDLHIAAARVAQARAMVDGTEAEHLPQVGLDAGGRRGRASSADPNADIRSGGFRASWEVDLFGANGLANAAAALDAQGAELAQQAMRIVIAADVATAWFEIQTLTRRKAVSRDAIAALERQLDVARHRFKVGQSSALDNDRLIAELHQEKAAAAQLRGVQRVRERQLAVLTGAAQLNPALTFADGQAPGIAVPGAVPPAELLERRPDVQQQARAIEAAAARLGVAKRDLYPRIQFDWAGRKERLGIEGTSASPATVVGYGIAVSLPIFDGGSIRANIAAHESQVRQAMAAYEKAMLLAMADAEVALTQVVAADASVSELEQAQRAGADASRRSERLFEAGLVGLNTVLEVRQDHLRALDALLQAQGAQWAARVSVRRAFAGRV